MSTFRGLLVKFQNSGIIAQLIYINLAAFVVILLSSSFAGLYANQPTFIEEWFALSSSFDTFFTRPWTIITYGFLHGGFLHILFNCIWLYFFGRLFLDYFTPKQLLNFYILGTLFGGIVFLLSMNYFPIFQNELHIVVGASAGVSAIVIGLAARIPNYQVKLALIGHIKVWHIAAVYVILDLASLSGDNAGGHFAHLGGALFGYFYVAQASKKKSSPLSFLTDLFKMKKSPLKTVHKSKKKRPVPPPKNVKSDKNAKIDEILDKISKSGYDTLSKEEKEFLFKQKK